MEINTFTEKSTELLALARQQGYAISMHQIVRWHRAGLLPRPQQQPLKDSRGTCSLYPSGTSEQLLLLCSLRRCERRFSHLAWQLWLAGYRVDYQIIYVQLQQAAIRISHWMQWLTDFKQIIRQQDAEQALDIIERYAEGPLNLQPLRRIRKRIGRAYFSTFLSRLLDLATDESSDRITGTDQNERDIDLRILARGLGLEKRFVHKQDALEDYLVQFLIPRLHWFFCWSQEVKWEELLKHRTYFELLQARDNLSTWLRRQSHSKDYRNRLPNDYPRWEINFQDMFHALSIPDQELVLIVWIALRGLSPSERDKMPTITIGPDGPSYPKQVKRY